MRQELQAQLFTAFPHLFTLNQPPTSTIPSEGITCGSGWYKTIHTLCTSITSIIDDPTTPYTRKDIQVTQVKQKEGELRFYLHYAKERERSGAITDEYERAQEESLRTCEECGEDGEIRWEAWLKVLCDGCDRKRGEEFTGIVRKERETETEETQDEK
jgi:hypothetical protein